MHFFLLILMSLINSSLKPQTQKFRKLKYCEKLQYCMLKVSHTVLDKYIDSHAISLYNMHISPVRFILQNACTFLG